MGIFLIFQSMLNLFCYNIINYHVADEDDDYDCDMGDYPSMESEQSVPSPLSSLSPRPSSLTESMQVRFDSSCRGKSLA
jgi:hypothetical protein